MLSFIQPANWLTNGPGLGRERVRGLKEDASLLAVDTWEGYDEWQYQGVITGPTQSLQHRGEGRWRGSHPLEHLPHSIGLELLILEAPVSSWVTHVTALLTLLTYRRELDGTV